MSQLCTQFVVYSNMGWLKTGPTQELLVKVQFTGTSYSCKTCITVSGCY